MTNWTLDADGYLADISMWSVEVAESMAGAEDIQLTDAHWVMIGLVQEYFRRFEHAPAMRPLVNWVKQHEGPEHGNSRYLHQLFPISPAKQLARIAGLPKPTKCL